MLNNCTIQGRLTRDPELRYTASNTPVVSFSLACERSRKNANGEYDTDFIDCISFGKTAEFVKNWFAKGMMAIVVGRIQSRNWEDRNGNKRTSIEINANEVLFGESKKDKRSGNTHYIDYDARAAQEVDDTFPELDNMSDIPF